MDMPDPSSREVTHAGRKPAGTTGLAPLELCSQAAAEGTKLQSSR